MTALFGLLLLLYFSGCATTPKGPLSTDDEHPERVSVQTQVEVSGPGKPVGSMGERTTRSFQYQTEFEAAKGRSVVLVDEPGRRVEFRFEDFKP